MTVELVQPTARRIGRSGRCLVGMRREADWQGLRQRSGTISNSAISRAQVVP
jgi:hypothetical protein